MGLQTTHIIYRDEQIRHFYLGHYLPLTTTADPMSRSLLKFKRGRQPDLTNWIRASLEGFSHYPLSPGTIILRALRHDETEVTPASQTLTSQPGSSNTPPSSQPGSLTTSRSTRPVAPNTSRSIQPDAPKTPPTSQPEPPDSLFPLSPVKPTPLDLLGQTLASAFSCQYLPGLLHKSATTLSNKGLTREQRETQFRNIYTIPHPLPDTHHPILLIDDILTTGATALAIIHSLRQSSHHNPIEVFTLAKATYTR